MCLFSVFLDWGRGTMLGQIRKGSGDLVLDGDRRPIFFSFSSFCVILVCFVHLYCYLGVVLTISP